VLKQSQSSSDEDKVRYVHKQPISWDILHYY
jgi:hypothetical protein